MDFPSNSKNVVGPKNTKDDSDEKPKLEKVVAERVILKPKSIGRRFRELFIGGESKSAASYVFGDVLLPAFKNMVVDATSKGIERLIYGDNSPRRRMGMGNFDGRPRVSYNTPVDRSYGRGGGGRLPDQPALRGPQPRRHDAGEIILYSNDEAVHVLERMVDVIDKFEVVTVADLYTLVGLPSTYVDNSWGWVNLQNAGVRQIREGFLLDLPIPEAI